MVIIPYPSPFALFGWEKLHSLYRPPWTHSASLPTRCLQHFSSIQVIAPTGLTWFLPQQSAWLLPSYWMHLGAKARMLTQVFIIRHVLETCVVSAEAEQRRKQCIKKIKNRSPFPRIKITAVILRWSQQLYWEALLFWIQTVSSKCWPGNQIRQMGRIEDEKRAEGSLLKP